ncbi:MAG: hypothetical protein NT086_16320 [Proteobacteria bacterium]|nr:hypothetical protein [Pseudomonadota bacterium]
MSNKQKFNQWMQETFKGYRVNREDLLYIAWNSQQTIIDSLKEQLSEFQLQEPIRYEVKHKGDRDDYWMTCSNKHAQFILNDTASLGEWQIRKSYTIIKGAS